jgi:hypothetical protein
MALYYLDVLEQLGILSYPDTGFVWPKTVEYRNIRLHSRRESN